VKRKGEKEGNERPLAIRIARPAALAERFPFEQLRSSPGLAMNPLARRGEREGRRTGLLVRVETDQEQVVDDGDVAHQQDCRKMKVGRKEYVASAKFR
jgi:hypothetical protein